jgi:hypothetical protein
LPQVQAPLPQVRAPLPQVQAQPMIHRHLQKPGEQAIFGEPRKELTRKGP